MEDIGTWYTQESINGHEPLHKRHPEGGALCGAPDWVATTTSLGQVTCNDCQALCGELGQGG